MWRFACVLLVGLFAGHSAGAQDLPARKAGLWKMSVSAPGAPAGVGDSQQCIDARTDADLQRKSVQTGPGECTQTAVRKTSAGHEFESICKTPQGRSVIAVRISGDPRSAYTVVTTHREEPARKGVPDQTITIRATWAGACPADMKPGDVRMAGASFNVNDMPDPGKMQSMKPEDLQKMIEQMKNTQKK